VLQSCINASSLVLSRCFTELKDSAGAARGMGIAWRVVSHVSAALKNIGDHTPLVGPFVKLVGSAVGAAAQAQANVNVRVRRIASCGASIAVVNACAEHVSRLLCLHLHSELLLLPANASADSLYDRFNSARGDAYAGKCADLAEKYSSTLRRDMMRDHTDSKKQVAVVLDGSASFVCPVPSFLLDRSCEEFKYSI
jgi:hypothetical protein